MGKTITDVEEFNALPVGAEILLVSGTKTDEWKKIGEQRWQTGDRELEARYFQGAVTSGNVTVRGEGGPEAGAWYYDGNDGSYYVVVASPHGKVTYVKYNSNLVGLETVADADRVPCTRVLSVSERPRGHEKALAIAQAQRSNTVLQSVLDRYRAGEAVESKDYEVRAVVTGTSVVTPTHEQALVLFGTTEEGLTIVSVSATTMSWKRTVTFTKQSDTGCACEQVTRDDLTSSLPTNPTVTSFEVLSCTEAGAEVRVEAPVKKAAAKKATSKPAA